MKYSTAFHPIIVRWRWFLLVALFTIPILFLVTVGIYHLWLTSWWFWAWWPISACFAVGIFLAWRWQKRQLLLGLDFTPAKHWTERDQEAWKLVKTRADGAGQIPPEQFLELEFYTKTAAEMALELARFYNPRAVDPIAQRTIPEILTVVELASHDLAELVDQYLPAGHMLTIAHWRQARNVSDWYKTATNITWLISSIFSPVNTAVRFLASRASIGTPWKMLQENLLLWFYSAYIHRVGTYLIELNSGRLRIGAKRYRELMGIADPIVEGAPKASEPAVATLTIVLFGQSKVGKSSLINGLLKEQQAYTNVLPATSETMRYELTHESVPTKLILLDTVGYGQAGPKIDHRPATLQAARDADVLLMVMHARNPARQADIDVLEMLTTYFKEHPELKKPPLLGVLTHIDLLSPSLEWQPPYNWQSPTRPKEKQIADAVAATRQQMEKYLAGVIPVCTSPGKELGVDEWLLPTILEVLDEAHAVALLRCLQAEADADKIRRVVQQLLSTGGAALKILWKK